MKTNSVRYRGNIYTLPTGTYKGEGSLVYLKEEGISLVITDSDGHEIARHIMPSGSGCKLPLFVNFPFLGQPSIGQQI